ncbi:MAG TPA: tetratricopeptide repeat protein [Candidatus Tidjanibacter gallistercoris]|nr:tetratricopeptide repeat protein [Candidatus Tidjanibacter gallistercoris]
MATQSTNANSKPKKGEHADPEQKIETALDKTELFFQKYTKQLLTGLLVVVIVVGGYFAYEYLVKRPRAVKAAEAMFVAEQLFAAGDYTAALEGDGSNAGFLDVVAQWGGTRPGRLAAHYAGVCYMKLGDFDAAMEYLGKYKEVKGAPGVLINAQNIGLKGDIHVERGDYAQAEKAYAQAADAADNVLTTPYYLRKLAYVYAAQGKTAEAVAVCERIKTEYASSLEARDIDKLIGEFGQGR